MKNLMPSGLVASLAIFASVASTAALADYEQQVNTAAKNQKRAVGQEIKAERAAANGNLEKAEKHRENMALDEHKANKDESRAARDAARGNF
jgi:hypothetical protein